MFIHIKFCLLLIVLSSISSTSHSSVIPAAVIRRHTITYKDVPAQSSKPIEHPVIYVPSSLVNLKVHFRTKSSKVNLKHVHKGNVGQIQHTVSQDEPHYLRHEIQKPVIQTIREVIVPYRQVIQQIKPVVEEVKTVVATGVPKSTVYMNFGNQQSDIPSNSYGSYGYVQNIDHVIPNQYNTVHNNHISNDYSLHSEDKPIEDNKNSYDLSSIYGIKTSVPQLNGYPLPKQETPKTQDQSYYSYSPQVYGSTSDIQQNYGISDSSGYNNDNSINESPVEYKTQNNDYQDINSADYKTQDNSQFQSSDYQNGNYQDNKNQLSTFDLSENIVPKYYMNFIELKNNANSGAYYTANTENNSGYVPQNIAVNQYSNQYSEDLLTSDGSHLNTPSSIVPIFGPYPEIPITKSTTLASLIQLMSALPYQYPYDNSFANKRIS